MEASAATGKAAAAGRKEIQAIVRGRKAVQAIVRAGGRQALSAVACSGQLCVGPGESVAHAFARGTS